MRFCPQINSRKITHLDSTVHAAACLNTGIATHQALELRTVVRCFIIKIGKEYDVIKIYRKCLNICLLRIVCVSIWGYPNENDEQSAESADEPDGANEQFSDKLMIVSQKS